MKVFWCFSETWPAQQKTNPIQHQWVLHQETWSTKGFTRLFWGNISQLMHADSLALCAGGVMQRWLQHTLLHCSFMTMHHPRSWGGSHMEENEVIGYWMLSTVCRLYSFGLCSIGDTFNKPAERHRQGNHPTQFINLFLFCDGDDWPHMIAYIITPAWPAKYHPTPLWCDYNVTT